MLQDDDEEGLGLPLAKGGEDLLDDIISMTPGDPWLVYDASHNPYFLFLLGLPRAGRPSWMTSSP